MALDYAHGAIQATTGAIGTTFTVSGLSFQPKALRFWWQGMNSATDAVSGAGGINIRRGVGFATSTSDRRCVGSFNQDGAGSANCGGVVRNDAVVATTDGAGATDGLLDLNAINSDGFQLIVDDVLPAALTIFWEAWGGSDITVAQTLEIAEPAATGNQDHTVTGFTTTPGASQVVMFAGCQVTAASPAAAATDSGFCVGVAANETPANHVVASNSDDGSATMDCDGYIRGDECLAMIAVAGGNATARATLSAWLTDGFRLNWLARATTGRKYIALAIKGGQWAVGDGTIDAATSSATMTVSGLAFQPIGLNLLSKWEAEHAAGTSNTVADISIGCGSSTTSRRSMGCLETNGTGSSEVNLAIDYDQVLVCIDSGGNLFAALDISAINSDGFQLIVDDPGTGLSATTMVGWLTFASKAGQTVAVGQVTETDTAQAIAWAPKRRLVNQIVETDTAQAVTKRKSVTVAQVSESDLCQSISPGRRYPVVQVSEVDLAQALVAPKFVAVAQVSEVDLAQAILHGQIVAVGQVSEVDTAQALAWAPKNRLVTQVVETDLAQSIVVFVPGAGGVGGDYILLRRRRRT